MSIVQEDEQEEIAVYGKPLGPFPTRGRLFGLGIVAAMSVEIVQDRQDYINWTEARNNNTTNLNFEDWRREKHSTVSEWAHSSPENLQIFDIACEAADSLLREWEDGKLSEQRPTLPCPLWKRIKERMKHPVRQPKIDRRRRGDEERRSRAFTDRGTEVRRAQETGQQTISFHINTSATTMDGTCYYLRGEDTVTTGITHTFSIPTPTATGGMFHDTIAVPIEHQIYTGTVTGAAWNETNGTFSIPKPAFYLQYGNWNGPYTITIPSQTWTAATTGTLQANVIYASPVNGEGQENVRRIDQELADTPECNFERIVKRHEIELAYINSKRLLKDWLKPDEYYSLMKFGFMIVPSKLYPDTDYWIYDDDKIYIDAFKDTHERIWQRYCLHAVDGAFQKYDRLLAKVALLKADEAEFLRRANQHPGDLPPAHHGNVTMRHVNVGTDVPVAMPRHVLD